MLLANSVLHFPLPFRSLFCQRDRLLKIRVERMHAACYRELECLNVIEKQSCMEKYRVEKYLVWCMLTWALNAFMYVR